MMAPMLEACPSFRVTWDEFVEEWKDDADGLPHYLALGDLARHLTAMLSRGETGSFPAIFAVVERWQVEGDEYVRGAATIGLLEGLQNGHLHESGTEPKAFEPFLLPESRKAWAEVDAFWQCLALRKERQAGSEG